MKEWSKEMKILLLRALDFDSNGEYVLKDGFFLKDRYTKSHIKIDNMAILPTKKGTIIIDCNSLSFVSFLEEFNIELDNGSPSWQ